MRNTHVCVKNPFKIVMCKDYDLIMNRQRKKIEYLKRRTKKRKKKIVYISGRHLIFQEV